MIKLSNEELETVKQEISVTLINYVISLRPAKSNENGVYTPTRNPCPEWHFTWYLEKMVPFEKLFMIVV